jgi:hypothetical protein
MANGGRLSAGGLPAGQRGSDVANAAVVVAAAVTAAAVIAYPFTLATYPPLTDLPFHAAQASIFRHYLDPAFHFREQFSLHPLEVPYVSMYALGAFFALFVSISAATKLMAITMLALVPAGLAVLFHGMKKSPLWGLSGVVLTWCTVTQWGFLNFMGAFGLFAMSIGFALLVVDRPTRSRELGLALTLVALFFTHVYRLPFAFVAVLLAGGFTFSSTRRFAVLFRPMVPALLLFALWLVIRPRSMGISGHLVGFHPERWRDIGRHLFGSYLPIDGAPPTSEGTLERALAKRTLIVTLFTMLAAGLYAAVNGHTRRVTDDDRRWRRSVTALVLTVSAGLLLAYFVLPLEAGRWFYIYPREIVGAALIALAVAPDLPSALAPRLGFVGLIAAASIPMSRFVSDRFREFDAVTADFRAIVEDMPPAPKLFYLVYWLGDSAKRATPFLHLPAWVQAEKGGALGFHFVSWNLYPIRYRQGSPDVPPPTPPRFEWTPQYFDVKRHGVWFDTFLVRHQLDPQSLFDPDPTIHLVSHRGTWWLYRRARTAK